MTEPKSARAGSAAHAREKEMYKNFDYEIKM
jgi:hypothetical protein